MSDPLGVLREWTTRLWGTFRPRRRDADLEQELRLHLELAAEDERRRRGSRADAGRAAAIRSGGVTQALDALRDQGGLPWIDALAQDARDAIRSARRSPGVTAVIVFSLALAIGATTAIFTLIDAVLLRPLPYTDAGRIVMLWTSNSLNGSREQNTSVPNLDDWKTRTRSFDDIAAYREADGPLVHDAAAASGSPEWIGYAWVSGNFFSVLGRAPALGRTIDPDDIRAGRPVAVVSYRLWRRSLGASTGVLGRSLNISGVLVEIVGVMPDDFSFPSKQIDVWAPESASARWRDAHAKRGTRFGAAFGRLRHGVALGQARADMDAIALQLQREYPDANANLGVNIVPLHEQIVGHSAPVMLALLFGAVVCVLLIACANVANLQLARGLARQREIAVRAALGAGRARIVRQLLAESVCLSCAGGAVGLVLVVGIIDLLATSAPRGIARIDEVHVNAAVLLFTLVVSIATGVLFGLAPAIRVSRGDANESLHAGSRNAAAGASDRAIGATFVMCQFALAVVLVAGAGLFVRSLLAVRAVDAGFGDRDAMTAHVRFHTALPRESRVSRYREAMARLAGLPGVRAAGAVATMFWSGEGGHFGLRAVDGRAPESRGAWTALTWTTISGDYFQALGIPLRRGRFFTDQDRRDSPPVVLVNETMARRFWPNEDPIGKRIKGFDPRGRNDDWVTVVGVVKDVRSLGVERAPMAQIFEAQAQSLDETENVVVAADSTAGLGEAIRKTIADVDRTAVVSDVAGLGRVLEEQSAMRRFETGLIGAFGLLALVLAGSGIFGIMHYSVAQRTQEIGIRVALGARRGQILAMVFREGATLAAVGVGAGIAGALVLMRLIAGFLFGISPTDPLTFAIVTVALVALAIAGCSVPAARAARVDPIVALRAE
jgi:predicted permease